jgi:hypothetical protein
MNGISKPEAVTLLANGEPGILDAAVKLTVGQQGENGIGRAFFCR